MRWVGAALWMTLVVAAPVAAQEAVHTPDVVSQVRQCMVQTRAPGSYGVFLNRAVPVVQADLGATEAGVRKVNDCLQDLYNVQYSLLAFVDAADATGQSSLPVITPGGCPRRASVLYGGRQYCVD